MIMSWKVVTLMLAIHSASAVCPIRCVCQDQTIDCSSRQLGFIPDDLPYQAPDGLLNMPPFFLGDQITKLNLSSNQLQELPIHLSENLPYIQHLDMSNNKILETKNVQSVLLFKQLFHLKLSSNPIKNLGLDKDAVLFSQSISHLDVSDCAISSITNPATFMFMMNLTHVNLSGNPLVVIDNFSSPTIIYLDLSRCLFGINDKGIRDEAFINLPSLKRLNLANNAHLTRIPHSKVLSVSLLSLDVSYCALEKVDFRSLPNLHDASLKGNIVKVLNDNMLSNNILLKRLEISENSIHHIENQAFKGGTSLEYLDLSLNLIQHVNWYLFREISNLKVLNISRNPLASLELIPLPKLLSLDASKCDIQSLSYNFLIQMQELKDLNLSHNLIEVLPKMKSSRLQRLDLSFCRLTDLYEGSFQGISSLTRLNLEGNRLTTPMKQSILNHLQTVEEMNLSDNPWTCDCNDTDFDYLWKFMAYPPKSKHLRTLTCHGPKEMMGKPWNACFQGLKTKDNNKHGILSFIVPFLTLCSLLAIIMVIRQVYSAHEIEAQRRDTQTSQDSDSQSRVFLRRIAPHFFDEDMERGIQMSVSETSQRSIRELSKLPSYEEALLLPKPEEREDLHKIAKRYEESDRFERSPFSTPGTTESQQEIRLQPEPQQETSCQPEPQIEIQRQPESQQETQPQPSTSNHRHCSDV